jgi:hypothetical protein
MKVRFLAAGGLVSVLGMFLAVNVFAASAHFWPNKLDDTTFQVMASDVKDAFGLTLEIGYDQTVFEKPVVTWGGFAALVKLSDMNTQTPGRISLVLGGVDPLPASGQVATISFTPKGKVSAKNNITVKPLLMAQGGTPLGASELDPTKASKGDGDGTVNPPGASPSGTGTYVAGGATTSISSLNVKGFNESLGTSSGSRTPGRIERRGEAEYEPPPGQPSSGGRGETAGAVRGEGRPEQKGPEKFVPNKSVLDRFKDFTGERTAAALTALFAPATPGGFTQTPAIALADGTSTLTVTLAGDPAAKDDPNFSLIRVRLVSLKRNEDGGWTIEAKPAKGTVAAAVAVSRSNVVTEYPLTVVPPADVKTDISQPGVTDADFALFLKERGTDKEPRFDMNGDGKRDYIDDYIYTANYLLVAGRAKPQEQGAKPQQPLPDSPGEGQGKTPEQPPAIPAVTPAPAPVVTPAPAEVPVPPPVEPSMEPP